MNTFPQKYAQTIIELHGEPGSVWLKQLPALISHCERRWSLNLQPPFTHLSYNYAAPARRDDGTDVVLKLGSPTLN